MKSLKEMYCSYCL